MVGSLCGGGETFDKMNGNAGIILGSNDESIVCLRVVFQMVCCAARERSHSSEKTNNVKRNHHGRCNLDPILNVIFKGKTPSQMDVAPWCYK